MPHTCKSIIFHCMDFRLVDKTIEWMRGQGMLGDCDVISWAGAGKQIADKTPAGKGMLEQIEISCKLHSSSQVILLHHSDCGAYKSSYNFSSPEEEKEKQFKDMIQAENIIREKFSQLKVIKVWAQIKVGSGRDVDFIKINK